MKDKDSLALIQASMDRQFRAASKELRGYTSVLDISQRTLTRLLGDSAKARKLRMELLNKLGHKYAKVEDDFLMAGTAGKLKAAAAIISKYSTSIDTTSLQSTRGKAREEFILRRSNTAGQRLSSEVNKYFESIDQYTSPELIYEARANANTRATKISLSTSMPTSNKELTKLMRKSFMQGAESETEGLVAPIVQSKKALLIATIRKTKKFVEKNKKKKLQSKRDKQKLNRPSIYFSYASSYEDAPESDNVEKGYKLQTAIRMNLHDTIQDDYMKESSAPTNRNYLRYQTGRFAKSAQVSSLVMNDTSVQINYGYLLNPYQVFERGAMNGRGRDPRVIIESAIRAIVASYTPEYSSTIQFTRLGG